MTLLLLAWLAVAVFTISAGRLAWHDRPYLAAAALGAAIGCLTHICLWWLT